MRLTTVTALALLAFAVNAAVAAAGAAEKPAPSASGTTAAPAPAPEPEPGPSVEKPLEGRLTFTLERVGGSRRTVLSGARIRVRGRTTAYAPDQRLAVRLYRGGRKIAVRSVLLQRSGAKGGAFLVGFRVSGDGRITVRASHRATDRLATMVAGPKRFRVVPARVGYGQRGPAVRELQRLLAAHGYVVGQRGLYDARTARAVLAFRKVTGMARTEQASSEVFARLQRGGGSFRVRYPSHGHHVEADLSRQVLALIDGGKVQRIYPMSSGAPVTPTVLGSFRVYMKTAGTNQKGMVYSSYFIRGYAIHGYASVPIYPASHGCLRVPVPDAIPIYNWLRFGDTVDVYW